MPEETPGAVARYEAAVQQLGSRAEAWAVAELEGLRAELSIRQATHERLMAVLQGQAQRLLSAWVDARPVPDYRAGEQCLFRLRIGNDTGRPLATVKLLVDLSTGAAALQAQSEEVVGPGEDAVLSVWFKPTLAGHHRADATVEVTTLRGEVSYFKLASVPFLIGAAAALKQEIHIDARTQRVGVFENIGTATRGGLVTDADWRPLAVRAVEAPTPKAALPQGDPLAVGHVGTGVVVEGGARPMITIDRRQGVLVEVHDPTLLAVLRPGDRLEVAVIGTDGAGRPLLSTRADAPLGRATAAMGQIVRPGADLAKVLRDCPVGARIEIRGIHVGSAAVEHPCEIVGTEGACIESPDGPVLRIGCDVVIRGLTIRGSAPEGQYAADGIEVRAGRVVLEDCVVSADAAGNLVPGRAISVAGPCSLELRGCTVQGSGLGVSVDVSWSGFATDTARGARVKVVDCEFHGVGTAIAVAGADRELRVSRSRFAGIGEAAVRVYKGASVSVEDCPVPQRLLIADPGATLSVKGSKR